MFSRVEEDLEFINFVCDADYDSRFRRTETLEDMLAIYDDIKDVEGDV